MESTYIKKATELLGKEPLRKLLEDIYGKMSRQMINKAIRSGYAPPEWHEIIQIGSNYQITTDQLMEDVYLNKRNCKPEVVRSKAVIFGQRVRQCPHPVGKHRQVTS